MLEAISQKNIMLRLRESVGLHLSCIYLQRINFDVVEYLSGKQYFEKESHDDFVKVAYYGAAIEENGRVLDTLSKMIYDNEGLIRFSDNIIQGMLLSDSEKAHDMVMDILKTSGRSEGLRQSIVEAIDFAKISVYIRFLSYIHEENLIRFSSVKRAFMCYTGIEEMADNKKAKIIEQGIYNCLVGDDLNSYLQSDSALDLYIGLYAIATESLENALEYIEKAVNDVANYQKAVMMLFILKCNLKVPYRYISKILDKSIDDKILGIILTRLGDQILFDHDEQKVNLL